MQVAKESTLEHTYLAFFPLHLAAKGSNHIRCSEAQETMFAAEVRDDVLGQKTFQIRGCGRMREHCIFKDFDEI